MAFINKFFSIKKKAHKNNNDNVGWAGFTFSDQQVRVILFRECEWQNRKLLFDSSAVRKVVVNPTSKCPTSSIGSQPNNTNLSNDLENSSQSTHFRKLSTDNSSSQKQLSAAHNEEGTKKHSSADDIQSKSTIIETSNGYAYQFNRPNGDINILGEMIFGSVALTFRGTCLKIHSLRTNNDSTKNLMCTHVFCPPVRTNQRPSVTNRTTKPLNSSSVLSSTSDISTMCTTTDSSFKCGQKSWPLDVPRIDTMETDSGLDQSAGSSISSVGPPSFMSLETTLHDQFSNSVNVSRRTFRNLTTSLDYWPSASYQSNSNSGPVCGNSYSSTQHSGSYSENIYPPNSISDYYRRNSSGTEESLSSSYSTRIKLGLAVIIELSLSQENELELYLLEHMPILDTIMWRLRDCVQRAYWRKTSFLSIMMDGSKEAATSIQLLLNSVNKNITTMPPLPFFWYQDSVSFTNDLSCSSSSSYEDTNRSDTSSPTSKSSDLFWKMFFKTDLTNLKRNETDIEKFVRIFCDLLKLLDNKDTNFFLSALITAVLSHHLGWILSFASHNNDLNSDILPQCSALWTQLSEMSGAIGCPSKYAQTVVVGKTDNNIIDVLHILSYFTRFSTILRKTEVRVENEREEEIFNEALQRLKNIHTNNRVINNNCDNIEITVEPNETKVIDTTNAYEMKSLNSTDLCSLYCITDNTTDQNDENFYCPDCIRDIKSNPASESVGSNCTSCKNKLLTNVENNCDNCETSLNKLRGNLKRTKTHTSFNSETSLNYHNLTKCIINNFTSSETISDNVGKLPKIIDEFNEKYNDENVVFVLGENEKLIGLKPVIEDENKKEMKRSQSAPPPSFPSSSNCPPSSPCHQRLKKHSGVKFNFEQYPKIATNYMKSKNLEIGSISFLDKKFSDDELSNFEVSKIDFPETSLTECQCGFKECIAESEEMILQTPSNASELESTNDLLPQTSTNYLYAEEKVHQNITQHKFQRKTLSNTFIIDKQSVDSLHVTKNNYKRNKNFKHKVHSHETENATKTNLEDGKKTLIKVDTHPLEENDSESEEIKTDNQVKTMKLRMLSLPLSRSLDVPPSPNLPPAGYKSSLLRIEKINDQYMPGVILQGITEPISVWSCALKRDLALTVRHSPIDQPISEAVCILADMDNWKVQLISSSSMTVSGLTGLPQVQNSTLTGIPMASSQLVGDMLESFQELWKLRVAPQFCLQHIEEKLREIYLRSFAFSELLLATDFCDMAFLTSALDLHPNDVPLLLAVASTHTPQVAQKYGVTFQ